MCRKGPWAPVVGCVPGTESGCTLRRKGTSSSSLSAKRPPQLHGRSAEQKTRVPK